MGWLGGLTVPDESADSLMRSVAARDIVFGSALISAASHGARVDRWLMMRAWVDGTDALGILFAFLRGGGNRRLAGLGGLAVVAMVMDLVLWTLAREEDATAA
jgi:hypothetical protein